MRAAWLMVTAVLGVCGAGQGAWAQQALGVWQTEKTDDGRYLHIEVHPCADAADRVCGTIVGAFGGAREDSVGMPITWDMVPEGPNAWDGGRIWKPDEDKVYDSEMELRGDTLVVSGCVLGGLICKSQDWPRVR
jgi:uncharacterized protein (DUF2147 family)